MKECLEVTSLSQLRLLAHPVRVRVMRLFSGERVALSVKQIAERLGEPHSKVHYHVRRLVEGGFLEPAGEQVVNGIVERFYTLGALAINIGPAVRQLPGYQGLLQQVADSIFEEGIQRVYQEAVKEEAALHVHFRDVAMTRGELDAFLNRLDRELSEYVTPRPGTMPVRWVVLASHPRQDEDEAPGELAPGAAVQSSDARREEGRPSRSGDPEGRPPARGRRSRVEVRKD
ncbi:MAG TPA: helix-turn-helix domain-containing protein [Limnochorda sp.]